jgi:hypothetical protein
MPQGVLRSIYYYLISAPFSVTKSTDVYLVICPRNVLKGMIFKILDGGGADESSDEDNTAAGTVGKDDDID